MKCTAKKLSQKCLLVLNLYHHAFSLEGGGTRCMVYIDTNTCLFLQFLLYYLSIGDGSVVTGYPSSKRYRTFTHWIDRELESTLICYLIHSFFNIHPILCYTMIQVKQIEYQLDIHTQHWIIHFRISSNLIHFTILHKDIFHFFIFSPITLFRFLNFSKFYTNGDWCNICVFWGRGG